MPNSAPHLIKQWGEEVSKGSDKLKFKCCIDRRGFTSNEVRNFDILIVSHTAFSKRENFDAFLKYGW